MPTEMMTMCFHTRDAVDQSDSNYTFNLPSNRLRTGAVKVSLASCEFPMVQWTIETGWNRLYMNDGIWLDSTNNKMCVVAKAPGVPEPKDPVTLCVPPRINRIIGCVWRGAYLAVDCEQPHGLWCSGHVAPLMSVFNAPEGVRLVGGGSGDVLLSIAVRDGDMEYVSPTSFRVKRGATLNHGEGTDALTVLSPIASSPTVLCTWLTETARESMSDGTRLTFTYDARQDRVVLTAKAEIAATLLRILPTNLARLCGLSTMPMRLDDGHVTWPCEQTHFWDYMEIPSGFYSPCHRSMCTGQPMKFGQEVESSVNRFYFPLSRTKDGEHPHNIIFSDSDGRVYKYSIPCGRYHPDELCRYLETGMTRAVESMISGIAFSISHENDRFVFSCERALSSGRVVPISFGLLFHHPLSVEPERLGFAPHPLSGSDTYTAPRTTRVPTVMGRPVKSIVRINEITHQKKFIIHIASPPHMIGVVVGGNLTDHCLHVRTYVNKHSFAHGFHAGDVVRIAMCGKTSVIGDGDDNSEIEYAQTSANMPEECTCIVLEVSAIADNGASMLSLQIPYIDGLTDIGTSLQITSDPSPWNMCLCRERSIPPHVIGFRQGAVLWGIDGSVADCDGRMRPPFEAPFSHNLDHPDYVLMTFSESSGAALEHSYNNENKHIFCKLSLYPLFREERMLPRDTTLLKNNLHTFTLSFWNPDMHTPYHFHGAQFSFSLSFLSAIPD